MVLQNYQNFIEMTSNMIYIVALGGGFKCLRKIHLSTQCPPGPQLTCQNVGPARVKEKFDNETQY